MVCTTVLPECQQNILTSDKEINEVLAEVRTVTGENWQIVEGTELRRRFLQRPQLKKNYDLYIEVGGVLPWQVITAVHTKRECLCYLYGILSGRHGNV